MQKEFFSRTTNTATMNKDKAMQKHNHRDEYTIKREMEKDPSRSFGDTSKDEVWFTLLDENHKTYKSIVNEIFKDTVKEYNKMQTKNRHKERCKSTYSAYWKDNKKTHCDSPVVEMIIQVGGTHDPEKEYATGKVDPEIGKEILKDFVESFQERYPLLKVIDCTYHQGEATPHVHLDFVPVAKDEKLGLTASLDKACEQMGFGEKSGERIVYSVRDFERDFHKILDDICESHGIEIDHPQLTREHESVIQFRKNEKLRQENKSLEKDNTSLVAKKKELYSKVHELSDHLEDVSESAKAMEIQLSELNKEKDTAYVELVKAKSELADLLYERTDAEANVRKLAQREKEIREGIHWYDKRDGLESFITESAISLLEYLTQVLESITENIFKIAGVEFSKTTFKLEDGNVAAKHYTLCNTNENKVLVTFNNKDTGLNQEVALDGLETLYFDTKVSLLNEIESGIAAGKTDVNVTEIIPYPERENRRNIGRDTRDFYLGHVD